MAFFCYNAVNLVVSFHVFVDVCATVDIKRKHSAGYGRPCIARRVIGCYLVKQPGSNLS